MIQINRYALASVRAVLQSEMVRNVVVYVVFRKVENKSVLAFVYERIWFSSQSNPF